MKHNPKHLAWHETLEMHELTAFQANNLKELLHYFPEAPVGTRKLSEADLTAYYAGHLLGFAKTSVRNYAIAITETATPSLRETLQKQLNKAIELHGKVYYFMYERGLYPSYNLKQLLSNDVKNANKAISL
ncbi:spore coat protein [Paenibacillus sp. FSL W8-0919]|uniref:spore coat protein n=1 Tax=Paenibacillus sp. FSL W8-0919 TaxID=2954707 RepID=UPI0030FC7087